MNSTRQTIGLQILLVVAAIPGADADDALVLHLPFDGSLGTPANVREVDFVPGRLGQAAHISLPAAKPAGTLSYDVSNTLEPRKGTLALWVKTGKDFGPQVPFGRVVDVRSEEDAYFQTWMRVSVKGKRDFTFDFYDPHGRSHGFNYTAGLGTWKAGQWHHLAVVWHCLRGVRVYDDGREVFSSWGQERWEPLTPTRLGFGCTADSVVQSECWFDEARLYTEPLSAEQVAALARGEDVRVAKTTEDFPGILSGNPGEKLRAELAGQTDLPVIELGRPQTIRQYLVKSAKVRKVTQGSLYDGELKGKRPVGGPVDVQFLRPVRLTALALDGTHVASRVGAMTIPAGRCARLRLDPPVETGQLRIEPHGDGPQLQEVRFYEVLGAGSDQPVRPVALPTTTSAQHVVRWSPSDEDVALAAVSLDLELRPPLPVLARFELADDAEPNKALLSADVRLVGEGRLKLTLDWPDYILHQHGSLIATVTFDRPVQVADGSWLAVIPAEIRSARDEYVTRQLGWFAAWYSHHAEAHVWDSAGWDPKSMPELRWLENVRRAAPENPLALAYYNRIFHHTREVEVAIPGPPEAPLWARAQREALRRTADVVHWWIDNRQTDDGQFGGDWNDDVEMLHGWDLLVLGAGDERVKQAMARLCDGIWNAGRFTRGYSNRIWDVEHAAEDSTYSQPRMVPLDYGNPKWLERCLEAASNFDFWTEINPQGHRHFKGYMFQAQQFRRDPETDSDVPDNARAAKIALYPIWYNGSERLRQLLREWADAWVEDSLRPVPGKPAGTLPGEIVAQTCQIGRAGSTWDNCKRYPLGAITYHMEDQLIGTYHFTGDAKYLAPIEAQIVAGRAGEAAQANWRRLTGSTKLDSQFIARAASGAAIPSFYAWLASGDKSHLANACTEVVRDFERNRFLVTEAEPPTDRVPLPGNVLLRQMLLGGIGVWVCGWPQMAVSWEQTGYDFAALVLDARPQHLRVLAYNFGPQREVTLRVWELQRGTYELRVGPDRDQDDATDEARVTRVELDRATRLPIELPGNALSVIELRQLQARPAGKRPDLAISAEDVQLSADRRTLTVTVHNIGSAPAENASVVVQAADGTQLGAAVLERLLSPDDLVAKTVKLDIQLRPPAPEAWQVVIAPEGKLDEITRENNRYGFR